jgi:hypothetical protein
MGDMGRSNTGDGVFTGREPHTSHQQMKLLNLIAGIAGTVTCCTGNELAAKSNPVLDFDKTIGLMYYHALLPNQRGTCNYAGDAMSAAIQLSDLAKVKGQKNAGQVRLLITSREA